MKEQFLNLTGLTELVGYLKTSIANHKEILPYASNKLFPSVGDINTIYINTATNTIYRWDSSSKTYITLAKAVKSVAISESTENGKITLTVDGNKTTVPVHGLGSAAYTNSSAYSSAGHTHTKAQVGLGNVDNTADANKSVKHATTADSATTAGTATSVPWSGVTGKPSSYPPASHNHDERYYTETEMNSKLAEKATKVHTHTKSEVGLGNVDNTADATKSVKYAISAGSASSAAALTSNAGSSTQPVYFSGGKPVACSYTLGKSVPADALFTDHTYGNMKGATSSSAGSAGLVPAPNIGEQLKFLRADGTWVIPTNTTYSVGTTSYSGTTKLYTSTGSATDGTMTQNAITTALNGKSATGHTHNYAGSSSAGGNANAAVKLATARKIGSASFDGTDDITLSQMGLNVPVEITKADYLAKKKAGTLNANTYYNVIDEYDSANVINDSSVTANSTFSSTKSEKTYAKKSTLVNTTLTASKWTGSSAPYSYVLSVSGVTSSNIVEIDYASNASSAAIEAYQNAMLADGGQTTNQITIKATEKPTVDIPITIVIRNDL